MASDDFNSFLQYLRTERNASDHTVAAYQRDITEFITRVLDGQTAFSAWDTIETDHARRFVYALHEAGDSKRSIQRKLSALRSFFRYMVRCGRVNGSVLTAISPPFSSVMRPPVSPAT